MMEWMNEGINVKYNHINKFTSRCTMNKFPFHFSWDNCGKPKAQITNDKWQIKHSFCHCSGKFAIWYWKNGRKSLLSLLIFQRLKFNYIHLTYIRFYLRCTFLYNNREAAEEFFHPEKPPEQTPGLCNLQRFQRENGQMIWFAGKYMAIAAFSFAISICKGNLFFEY